ncbi:carboxypeptidase-like protein [Flavobacteriaceae bacterium MAR_2010_72]|nr:carboxypeptidase-like protein [Flavobacteriaceae bacterium MAR_2010_72]TVZ57606.1 carboxypeptidase-like protein [Flavobacteriaceae bacterium MAR_2010_105]
MKAVAHQGFFSKLLCCSMVLMSYVVLAQDGYAEYKGIVIDSESKKPLEAVMLNIKNTNIATVTNVDGQFVLKVTEATKERKVVFSILGYQTKEVDLSDLIDQDTEIALKPSLTELSQVNVTNFKNAEALVRKVFENKSKNNLDKPVLMTAFYRETIKKRNRDVSLTEAVVNLYKQPYTNNARDVMALHKARKSTDYKILDTLAFKLQGGPFSTLYLDIMKYPEYIFSNETIGDYNYSFEPPSTVNDKLVYVVKFNKKDDGTPLGYRGKLYIDANSLALTSATYALNIEDKRSASEYFVRKKPRDVVTYPTEASYKVNYQEKEGKWYYSYGSVNLTFKVNKKRKLFNSVYSIASEMAVTDWETAYSTDVVSIPKDRIRPNIIISDAISGFSDPDFWGAYNLIEPDKSIESAIDKIRRKLRRED